ncbi:MAG TPA: Rrf2 family transcriptional regulator [Ignavibacteriaceae bacterium]|nr:Rrf2 family transcriptional regulator [Ignavibacteriaceae bacterium]
MLRLSKKSEYALMAVKYIALQQEKNCVTAREISQNYSLPYELICKVLQQLTKYKIVNSVQGAKGGYRLSKIPGDISLIEVITAVEPNYQITNCMKENSSANDCSHFNCCMIRNPLIKIQNEIDKLFKNMSVTEII